VARSFGCPGYLTYPVHTGTASVSGYSDIVMSLSVIIMDKIGYDLLSVMPKKSTVKFKNKWEKCLPITLINSTYN